MLTVSKRLGVLVSHPIQYYSPWFRDLAKKLNLQVFYSHKQDAEGQSAAGFGVDFEWDIPLLEGYPYQWLDNRAKHPGLSHFFGCDNPELWDIVDSSNFDAFLIFGWNRKSSWQAMRACWRHNIPVLMRGDSQAAMVSSTFKRIIKGIPYRWFLSRISAHLYPGVRNREYLESFGVRADNLFWCPHFIDDHFFASRAEVAAQPEQLAQLRGELGVPERAFVVLYVGKLIEKKNPLDFIAAVKQAAAQDSSIHGVVVGAGPLEAQCRLASSEQIHFAGFRNQTKLPAYYALADALVLPSDGSETWGLVVNEAMACGTPCIVSSSCGCAPDMIEPGETGYVFSEGDVSGLSYAIAALKSATLKDPVRITQSIRIKAKRYSLATASDRLIDAVAAMTA